MSVLRFPPQLSKAQSYILLHPHPLCHLGVSLNITPLMHGLVAQLDFLFVTRDSSLVTDLSFWLPMQLFPSSLHSIRHKSFLHQKVAGFVLDNCNVSLLDIENFSL